MSDTREALVDAAQAILDRWNSPRWEWAKHSPTADLMERLRAALAAPAPAAAVEREAVPVPLTGCNCRWQGETYVEKCELHEAWHTAIHEWAERAKAAEAALASPPPQDVLIDAPEPYLCMAPACGSECSDCNCAISPEDMRKYAIRYALLQRMDPRFGMPTKWLNFKTLDEALDSELAAIASQQEPQE